MVVQDLADETDVFMEFGHLSNETRKKIEEFRRRRKEAEEYNENSPIKPPKTPRTDGQNVPELTSKEKSLRNCENEELKNQSEKNNENPNINFSDPLERLKQLETRLGVYRKNQGVTETQPQEETKNIKQQYAKNKKELEEEKSPQAIPNNTSYSKTDKNSNTTPTKMIVSSSKENIQRPSNNDYISNYNAKSRNLWNLESDSLNLLMNQVCQFLFYRIHDFGNCAWRYMYCHFYAWVELEGLDSILETFLAILKGKSTPWKFSNWKLSSDSCFSA
jgi:hypothetical protein